MAGRRPRLAPLAARFLAALQIVVAVALAVSGVLDVCPAPPVWLRFARGLQRRRPAMGGLGRSGRDRRGRWRTRIENHAEMTDLEQRQPDASADQRRLRRKAYERRVRRRRVVAGAAAVCVLGVGTWALAARGDRSQVDSPASGAHPTMAQREVAALDRLLERTQFMVHGRGRRPEVALTFDDGPGPYTPEILEILARHGAKATFFTVGNMLESFHASSSRELRRGNAIGNHTFDHARLATLEPLAQAAELDRVEIALRRYGMPAPRLFRPPDGSYDHRTLEMLHDRRMLMVLWSVDTGDYANPGSEVIVQRALEGAEPGAIILMHDAGGDRSQTVAALPEILRGLRERGLRPVTIRRLILDDPPPRGQTLPSNLDGALDAPGG